MAVAEAALICAALAHKAVRSMMYLYACAALNAVNVLHVNVSDLNLAAVVRLRLIVNDAYFNCSIYYQRWRNVPFGQAAGAVAHTYRLDNDIIQVTCCCSTMKLQACIRCMWHATKLTCLINYTWQWGGFGNGCRTTFSVQNLFAEQVFQLCCCCYWKCCI